MEEYEITEKEPETDPKLSFLLYRIVFLCVLLAAVLIIKYTSKDTYKDIKWYYKEYAAQNITANTFLEDSDGK